jgi:lactoylglutathione lyase
MLFSPSLRAEDLGNKEATAPAAPDNSALFKRELRKPGFLFLELNTARTDDYIAFFGAATDFKLKSNQQGFAEMETDIAQIMFMNPAGLPKGHPFYNEPTGSGRGYGVEMGFVVADLDQAYKSALTFKDKGFKISSGIAMRPWGVRDFRVLTPDGYYLRFTEGPKGK